jgi:hypothetical protein
MELRDALAQISEIRLQMARTEVFRGYRAAPVAISGVLAFVAAGIQAIWITEPADQIAAYLSLWVVAAVASGVAAGVGMVVGGRHAGHSVWRRRITWLAIEQFVPCLVAGGLATAALLVGSLDSLWLLPGLWQVFFSLGIFASCRLLPRPIFGVGVFYLASGVTCLAVARGDAACSPWAMGVPFGVGQFLAAAILYWTLERGDVDQSVDSQR